jgi:mxaJ protein
MNSMEMFAARDSLERNHTAILAILAEYHLPVLPDAFATR